MVWLQACSTVSRAIKATTIQIKGKAVAAENSGPDQILDKGMSQFTPNRGTNNWSYNATRVQGQTEVVAPRPRFTKYCQSGFTTFSSMRDWHRMRFADMMRMQNLQNILNRDLPT
ncbi:hypothetical protein ACH5RR_040819 [Cinchona calisaya]|uniref:Uncharacterized protein n=1 Tax=Cinchona calisaya TaxID=153742 RepID=A0ABD2XSF5_9GENT